MPFQDQLSRKPLRSDPKEGSRQHRVAAEEPAPAGEEEPAGEPVVESAGVEPALRTGMEYWNCSIGFVNIMCEHVGASIEPTRRLGPATHKLGQGGEA